MPRFAISEDCFDQCMRINEQFREEMNSLYKKTVINEDSLLMGKIGNALKKIDRYYQKVYEVKDVDGRFFLQDRKKNITPSKFTPFTK